MCHFHINVQELFAVVGAVLTWVSEWCNQQVILYTGNASIIQVWKTGTCQDKDIMILIRYMFSFTAQLHINILLQHIPGHINLAADLLSLLQV